MLFLFACTQPPLSREEVLAACGLGAQEVAPLWSSEGNGDAASLDEACVTAMADAFRVDWDDLIATPADAADPSHPLARLFGGLYTLLAADLGTVGELRAALTALEPALSAEEPAELLAARDDADPARAWFWDYATSVVTKTTMIDDADCTLSSLPYGTMQVCSPWLYGDITSDVYLVDRANPAVASTVVHEAFHQATGVPGHLESVGCEYDADAGGAYGTAARWMWIWSITNADHVSARDAELAAIGRQTECAHIEDREGFAPCEGALPGLCNPQAVYTPMPDP